MIDAFGSVMFAGVFTCTVLLVGAGIALALPSKKVTCLCCGYPKAELTNYADGNYYCKKCGKLHQADQYKEFASRTQTAKGCA